MPWELEHYRKMYSKFILEATSGHDGALGDGQFTEKSALYHAAFEALVSGQGPEERFLERLFKEVKYLRPFSPSEFLETLGREADRYTGQMGQLVLKDGLSELFKP